MDVEKIRELAQIMQLYDLTGLKVETGESSVELERKQTVVSAAPSEVRQAPQSVPENGTGPTVVSAPRSQSETIIASPMVGVFYSAPSPESDSFVEVGSRVNQGDVLCIIEAMKLMNEIVAENDGIITEICAENGEVVEAGQPLFRMEIKK